MRVALFVPCYIDQLRPGVGLAALDVLEAFGFDVVFPEAQTCCGQPFLTAGESRSAKSLFHHYLDVFEDFDQIVTLSGSCAATVRCQLPNHVPGSRAKAIASHTFEFCEFLVAHDVASRNLGHFPHRVGLHASCHALRELGLGTPSELRHLGRPDPARSLLSSIQGLQLVDLTRSDECCGFGGVFSVEEEAVSCRMGLDRLADHQLAGSEVITSTDISCLFQLQGLGAKSQASGAPGFEFRMLHVAELLAESLAGITSQSTATQQENGGLHGTS
ncbi:MAG: (Fe-S)-binding protein [Myxococcales bacterium]|nr:(Fe-S)-binding protein [Myxococcales bacterium]HIK84367.1 (Fe-S)-binding protein [Myxococcales bacterium]